MDDASRDEMAPTARRSERCLALLDMAIASVAFMAALVFIGLMAIVIVIPPKPASGWGDIGRAAGVAFAIFLGIGSLIVVTPLSGLLFVAGRRLWLGDSRGRTTTKIFSWVVAVCTLLFGVFTWIIATPQAQVIFGTLPACYAIGHLLCLTPTRVDRIAAVLLVGSIAVSLVAAIIVMLLFTF